MSEKVRGNMTGQEERKGWCLFHDWVDALDLLDKSSAWEIIKAIDNYYLTGEDPLENLHKIEQQVIAKMMFQQIRRQEEISAQRKKAGQEGGFAKARNVANIGKTEKSVANVATYTDTNTYTNTITNIERGATPNARGRYNNVILTDAEVAALSKEFPNDYTERIERLSEYMAVSGKTYKSHIATIRNWAKRDAEKLQRQQQSGKLTTSFETDGFWKAALARTESLINDFAPDDY